VHFVTLLRQISGNSLHRYDVSVGFCLDRGLSAIFSNSSRLYNIGSTSSKSSESTKFLHRVRNQIKFVIFMVKITFQQNKWPKGLIITQVGTLFTLQKSLFHVCFYISQFPYLYASLLHLKKSWHIAFRLSIGRLVSGPSFVYSISCEPFAWQTPNLYTHDHKSIQYGHRKTLIVHLNLNLST
jgi:hypothetical protein